MKNFHYYYLKSFPIFSFWSAIKNWDQTGIESVEKLRKKRRSKREEKKERKQKKEKKEEKKEREEKREKILLGMNVKYDVVYLHSL